MLAAWLLACWARSIGRAVLLVIGTMPSGAGLGWRGAVCWALLLIIAMLSGGVAGLYGGEANEVIRFMAGPSEPDADEHRDEERYLAELASEVSALDAIQLATSVDLNTDGSAIA